MNNEYTTTCFRLRSTDCTQRSNDVGLFLSHQIYHRTTHSFDKSEVYDADGYKHQANRSAEADATRSKSIGVKYSNISELYN